MNKKSIVILIVLLLAAAAFGAAYMAGRADDVFVTTVKELDSGETVEVSGAAEAAAEAAAQAESEANEEAAEEAIEVAEIYGEVTEITDEYVMILADGLGDVKVLLSEDTVIEGVEALNIGQTAKVLYTGMMTRSLPPQITALLIGVYAVTGKVTEVAEGRVTITGENGEVILTLPEGAIAPAVGDAVTAYTTGVSTMSLPPQMNAVAIETADSVG